MLFYLTNFSASIVTKLDNFIVEIESFLLQVKNRKLFKFLLILTLSLFFTNVKAADGCYVGGVLYTSHTKSGAFFYRTPGDITADCGVTGTISGSCRLYNGSGSINQNNKYTQYSNSYSTNISVVVCPLDDKVWLLMIGVAGFSFFKFKSGLKLNVIH